MRILLLGGTTEALQLAAQASTLPDITIISSLAGRTRDPVVPGGPVRVGGFGGEAGLVDYLRTERIDRLIDATHPFAAQISLHAAGAARICGLPHLMLQRPAWQPTPADRWIEVPDHAAAAAVLPELGQRIFLTIGRQELAAFAHLTQLWFLMRMIDPPASDVAIPPGQVLLERGPFSLEQERSLLSTYGIEAIVSKNSGGDATVAKLIAARERHLPVVMVQRPQIPSVTTVPSVAAAIAWIQTRDGEEST